ncbi:MULTISPECIES: polysialyltransferase family glycosyltransferase [Methanobacterium]|uniref:Uncharacterized protein n=1 Tax=Methanobacterium bryantii TaxID=2161 RepID=A0A2A2H4M9_METBR|nr:MULTISPECIES: polysialyltransferase family glycosyltransferase [Methanobacterium]OEC84684.1 hypothetical protein A9507_15005 [Methanobacterium sp. A39]PAV04276.1 hypothetical protein ASJ80_05350 [Methanobacterium bryantii]
MEFSFEYIINYIANENIDFIAIVTSNWHAVGVDAFLYDLYKENNRKLKGVIIVNYHFKNGYCINENDFVCTKFSQVKFFYLKNLKFNLKGSLQGFSNLLLSKNKSKKVIHIIYVIEPSFSSFMYFKDKFVSKKYIPKYILIDEGFGTYASKKSWKSVLTQECNFRYSFQPIIRIYFIKTFLSILRRFFFNIFPLEKRFIFKKRSNKLIPNQKTIESYKSVLNIRNEKLNIKYNENENFIILATSVLSEYNIIPLDIEIMIINKITSILRSKGILTIIKPHPRELNGKYSSINMHKVKILDNNFPLEYLLSRLNPICIIGYASTALVNAKVFYGIDSIDISNIVYQQSRNKSLEIGAADFKKLTKDLVFSVSDLSEIEEYLEHNFNL